MQFASPISFISESRDALCYVRHVCAEFIFLFVKFKYSVVLRNVLSSENFNFYFFFNWRVNYFSRDIIKRHILLCHWWRSLVECLSNPKFQMCIKHASKTFKIVSPHLLFFFYQNSPYEQKKRIHNRNLFSRGITILKF